MTVVVGADGAQLGGTPGWVVTRLVDGSLDEVSFQTETTSLREAVDEAEVVGVDTPIGHADRDGSQRGGRRVADEAARDLLGPRSASVFPVPPVDLLDAASRERACREAQARGSIQPTARIWAMADRIQAVGRWAREDERVAEVHPEVSFALLGEQTGEPEPLKPKRTWDGLAVRRRRLATVGLSLEGELGGTVGRVAPHDLLDSLVVAWSAHRVANGDGLRLPEDPPTDPEFGRPVAIHA